MAKRDALTQRRALIGNSRSHALNATKRKWNLNLHKIKINDSQGRPQVLKISARTLRTLKKQGK